ncbi:MAG TPA: lysylphosphatidylglycerol synthase transmembrane domain-containing protein [Verrucomicrobiae bacterium]|jgi:glycosyltransferase 2 family protein|nr:lysylphosphatidylglycerol synthase transmembrane domain-containing protein [Verrucomicrobiae bacterium]
MKQSLTVLLKGLISIGLLLFFLSRIDFFHFVGALSNAKFSPIVLCLVIYLAGQLFSSIRWALLARTVGFQNGLKNFAQYYLIGMFFSLFTPSTVGGDVGRVFYLSREGANRKQGAGATAFATISVLADRAVGMAVLVWIGAVALLLFPEYTLPQTIRYITFAISLGLLFGMVSLPLLSRIMPGKEHRIGKNLHLALQSYPRHWRALGNAMLISLAVHFMQAWMHVLIGRALDFDLPFSYALIIYPLVGTFSALPVSLNGIGLREGGYLFLLTRIGVSSEKAIAFGLLWFIVVALDSLIGGLIFILKKKPEAAAVAIELED